MDIDTDVDVQVDVDLDSYFGCLKGVSKSVRVLLNGMEAIMGIDFEISELARPVFKGSWGFFEGVWASFWVCVYIYILTCTHICIYIYIHICCPPDPWIFGC